VQPLEVIDKTPVLDIKSDLVKVRAVEEHGNCIFK
jgi:tRNA (Thr-GGU) A37 N-methylase